MAGFRRTGGKTSTVAIYTIAGDAAGFLHWGVQSIGIAMFMLWPGCCVLVQVEYHALSAPDLNDKEHYQVHVNAREALHIMRSLQKRGLRPFNVEPNLWYGAQLSMSVIHMDHDLLAHTLL